MLNIETVKTEYRTNPIGIETQKPRFSWAYSEADDLLQKSYRIFVASTPERLEEGRADKWDSGWVRSDCSIHVAYEGRALVSSELCYVKVLAETTAGPAVSGVFTFEMGLFEQDWHAAWRSCPLTAAGAAKIFRRNFKLPQGKIRRARAYVCGLGYHECYVNGKKVSTGLFNPAVTDCDKEVLYNTYDITDCLEEENAIGIWAGNGWFGDPKVMAEIYVLFEDGREVRVFTGPYERCWLTRGSPIVSNTLFDGEVYDARLEEELTGWSQYNRQFGLGNGWYYAVPHPHDPAVHIRSQQIDEIRTQEKVTAVSVCQREGISLFDFGRILTGREVLRVRGERGAKVCIRFAECIDRKGNLDRSSLRNAKNTDVYILAGGEEEFYTPRFSYRGFRFAEVRVEGSAQVLELSAETLRTDSRVAGSFSCSDPFLNELHRLARETESCNHHSILTDCPQRDERMGWLNDLSSRLFQTVNNFGMELFFPKIAQDIDDTMEADGSIKDTAPYYLGNSPADPVSVAGLLIGKMAYELYGDSRLIEKHYENNRKWVEFLTKQTEGGVLSLGIYGDWCPAISVVPWPSRRANRGFPIAVISTMYLFWHYQIMHSFAKILGRQEDEICFAGLAAETRRVINQKFYNREKACYGEDVQAANAVALSLGIAEDSERPRVLEAILKDLEQRNWHMTCGNQSYRHLIGVLAENGHSDTVLKLLKNREYPGWGYMVACGATTVWERWESQITEESENMHSYCHPMFGSYDYWFFQYLGGIKRQEQTAAMKEFIIEPDILPEVPEVNCRFETLSGLIEVCYKADGDRVDYRFRIPPNTVAVVRLPGEPEFRLTSGLHTGTCKAPRAVKASA